MEQRPSRAPHTGAWMLALCTCSLASLVIGMAIGRPNDSLAAGSNVNQVTSTSTISGVGSSVPSDVSKELDFKQFWDLWRQVKERYYKQPLDEKKMMYGAMQGMVASLEDPYTTFFEPKSATEFSQSLQGKFEGIGAEIGIKEEQLQVIAPLPESPAEKAGIRSGDAILKIDGTETVNMSIEKAVSLIRGDKGTKVVLTLGRFHTEKDKAGKDKQVPETIEVSIVRDVIVVKSVRVTYKDDVAIIEISHFNQDTDSGFTKAVDEVLGKTNIKGIILDLRNDPGGYLDRSISVASEWVGENVIVSERRQGKIVDEYRGVRKPRLNTIPTIVLVNQGSASASEIVAGALQDYGVARLVGMKTFGKGSVQDYSEFPDKSAVKITIAEWLTPKGRSINKTGIEPDVTVDRTIEDYHADRDPQLDKAIELITGKKTSTPPPTAKDESKAKSSESTKK
ncbi:S41 family peptidase [Candidatus Uhrbacteria bacterium]|nr:S41 family peptidase [Candidatus Uhrbacteria bacterium]